MCTATSPGQGGRKKTPSGVIFYENTPAGNIAATEDQKKTGGGGDKDRPDPPPAPPVDLTDCTAYTDAQWDTGCSKSFRFSQMKYKPVDGQGSCPAVEIACNWQKLCQQVLDPLKAQFPAININSGYRTRAFDISLGGSGSGDHTWGRAADLSLGGVEGAKQIFKFIRSSGLPFSQLLYEGTWTHVALGGSSNAASAIGVTRTGGNPFTWHARSGGGLPSDLV